MAFMAGRERSLGEYQKGWINMKVICWHTGGRRGAALAVAKRGHRVFGTGKMLAAVPVATGTAGGFTEVMGAILGIADWLCWGVIVFAGASWMLGNKTKAIEHIIGGCSGYVIVRHASDIRDFLRGL
jgi:hypothetical protein